LQVNSSAFAFNRFYSSSSYGLEEKRERLRHLVTRAHTVVEEADAQYITNSGMLVQLKEHRTLMQLKEDIVGGYV
jgi:hypothetical protein